MPIPSLGYLSLIFIGILAGILLEALGGVEDAGIAGVGVVCPGAMLWLLSLPGVHLYVRWRYGERGS